MRGSARNARVARSQRLAVLTVHYRYPALLEDHLSRLARCAEPTREGLGAELRYFAIVHPSSLPEAVAAVAKACRRHPFAAWIDLRDRPLGFRPTSGRVHGWSLARAFEQLTAAATLAPGDLVALLDHDAHPLATGLFAALGEKLRRESLAGIGIPQWQRRRWFLHPSLLLTSVETVREMGTGAAFEVKIPLAESDETWHDTAEGFTLWCRQRGRPLHPLRVTSTAFPWERWDSDNVPGGGTELTGEHGEPVRVGYLMRYGLDPQPPLVSHVCAGPLGPYHWMRFSDHREDEVFTAYLEEPLA
ncbi:MAG TPA: hypothetical protein VOA87_18665 [Thermoanaerobaculia bacterium]|nr:hypothetical protein [Thermoanaerobaculia bacterium]